MHCSTGFCVGSAPDGDDGNTTSVPAGGASGSGTGGAGGNGSDASGSDGTNGGDDENGGGAGGGAGRIRVNAFGSGLMIGGGRFLPSEASGLTTTGSVSLSP